ACGSSGRSGARAGVGAAHEPLVLRVRAVRVRVAEELPRDPRAVEAEEGAVRAHLVRGVVTLRHALAERPGGQITREAAALQRRGPHHARGAPVDAGDAAGPRVLVGRVGAVDETIAQVVFGDGRESVDADEAAAAEVLV